MSQKGHLNQTFLKVVALSSAFFLFSYAIVLAQQSELAEEEQEVDLDSLGDELDEQPEKESDNAEKFLPMNVALVELERNPALMLVALAVLVPLSTMLIPLERMRKGKRSQLKQNRKTNT